jgi:hypothetical protein
MPFPVKWGMKGTDPDGNTDKSKHVSMFWNQNLQHRNNEWKTQTEME